MTAIASAYVRVEYLLRILDHGQTEENLGWFQLTIVDELLVNLKRLFRIIDL